MEEIAKSKDTLIKLWFLLLNYQLGMGCRDSLVDRALDLYLIWRYKNDKGF